MDFLKKIFSVLRLSLPFLASLFSAFGFCGILIIFLGENPFYIASLFLQGAFGSLSDIGYTLFYATPLLFTGVAVAVGLKGGLFNIGAEGQLYAGAFAAAWVGFTCTALPSMFLIPFAVFAAAFTLSGIAARAATAVSAKYQCRLFSGRQRDTALQRTAAYATSDPQRRGGNLPS